MEPDGRTEIASSPTHGRFLVACRPFQPGDIVLGPEAPFALALHDPSSRCDCCLTTTTNPRRCGGCRLAHYLDADHQRRGWTAGHKHECAALAATTQRVPSSLLLASRVLRRHHQQPSTALEALVHKWDDVDSNRKVMFAQMAVLATYAAHAACLL